MIGKTAESYNCYITGQTEFSATTVAVQAVAKSAMRRCLIIQNKGTGVSYISFDSASTAGNGLVLTGASTYWQPVVPVTNSIYIRSATGTNSTVIMEGK